MTTTATSRISPQNLLVHVKMSCIMVDKSGTLVMDDTVQTLDPVFYLPKKAMLSLAVCFYGVSISSAVK